METYKLSGCWIMIRDSNIHSLLIQKLTHSQVSPKSWSLSFISLLFCVWSIRLYSYWASLNFVCRWDVYLWLCTHTSLLYLSGHFQGWWNAWPSTYNNPRTCYDAWLCYHWELCHLHGPAFVLPSKGNKHQMFILYFNEFKRLDIRTRKSITAPW